MEKERRDRERKRMREGGGHNDRGEKKRYL